MLEDFHLDATTMADQDLCIAVGETLYYYYPGHPWGVGVNLEAGAITIELGYQHPRITGATFGYLLHPQTLKGKGGIHRVMLAGGELLERYDLARGAATDQSAARAAENGLIISDTEDAQRLAKRRAAN